jgi:hypothetical protein
LKILFNYNIETPSYLNTYYKFKIIRNFYLTRFLNSSVKHGKKQKYFKVFFKHYYTQFINFNYFYRKFTFTIQKTKTVKPFFLKNPIFEKTPNRFSFFTSSFFFDQNRIYLLLNFLVMNFFKHNTFILSFFVEKHKTFINHKKKFLDKIIFVYVREHNKKYIFFKFLKILFLKKKMKQNIVNMLNYNFFEFSESLYKSVFENLIFEIGAQQKKK